VGKRGLDLSEEMRTHLGLKDMDESEDEVCE
jgi:hypothetical protein